MARQVTIFLVMLLLSSSVYATTFDYVKNPSLSDLNGFTGAWSQVLHENNAAKTGYFFMQTVAKNRYCQGSGLNSTTSSVITSTDTKNGGDCNNVMDVGVNVYVDNQNYYLTPYARVGDYDKTNEHISVVPYSFNTWVSKDKPITNNYQVCEQVRTASYSTKYQGKPFSVMFSCAPESLYTNYEYYINNKKGVCDSHVYLALGSVFKSTYYSNPSDLNIPGYGTITSDNCNALMFPENSGNKDRVGAIYFDQPEVFNSLMYNENYQYTAYPFYINSIEYSCYDRTGKLLVGGSTDDVVTYEVRNYGGCTGSYYAGSTSNCNGDITYTSNVAQEPKYPVGIQYYDWTRTNGFVLKTPEASTPTGGTRKTISGSMTLNPTEANEYHITFSCPIGTNYYTTSVVLRKNADYRHLSPVDFTYHWADIFNQTVTSKFKTGISTLTNPKSQLLIYTQAGGFSQGNVTQNNVITNNDMNNTITENATSTTTTGVETTQDCYSCQQNITLSGVTLAGGTGSTSGGSSISNGVDDSAVSGLMQQATGQNDAAVKASFIEKLLLIADNILAIIIVAYGLFALMVILMVFLMLFNIPKKMAESVKALFMAGTRK